jgi:hypothetical protein
MTDGINLTGFGETKGYEPSPWATESYTEALAGAFPAKDMSSQGNAGLNGEGSSDTGTDAPGVSEGMYS